MVFFAPAPLRIGCMAGVGTLSVLATSWSNKLSESIATFLGLREPVPPLFVWNRVFLLDYLWVVHLRKFLTILALAPNLQGNTLRGFLNMCSLSADGEDAAQAKTR